MCCGGYGFVPAGADVISSLRKGDQITLAPKYGMPAVDEERTLIIAEVALYSALCTDGTRLTCHDAPGIKVVSHDNPVELSHEAVKVLNFVGVARLTVGEVIKVAPATGWPNGTAERTMVVVKTNRATTTAVAVDREYLQNPIEVPMTNETFVVLTQMDGMRVTQIDDYYLVKDLPEVLIQAMDDQGVVVTSD